MDLFWTVSAIAKELDSERHRVAWVIERNAIRPLAMVGHARLFDDAAFALIRSEIERLNAKRAGVVDAN